MIPIFRFIDWMLREHGAFISGSVRLCGCPTHRLVFGAAFREKENQDKRYVCLGDSAARANIVGRAARDPLEFRAAG